MGIHKSGRFLVLRSDQTDINFEQTEIAMDPAMHGAMMVPIILGADKTTVSVATGQNEYHPVYLSIRNVHNSVHRAHRDALLPVAFLSIPKCTPYYLYWVSCTIFRSFKLLLIVSFT
jgi:hypothetical protein